MTNLVAQLTQEEERLKRSRLSAISPNDGKYGEKGDPLREYLTAGAEWHACAHIQYVLLQTREEFGQAGPWNVTEVEEALSEVDPLNMALLEETVLHHDQLAVIEEIGRYVSEETKALLHPGTTSYDILDTARSWLFKKAWTDVIRPVIENVTLQLCDLSERSMNEMQAGRTHLQKTSPVPFGATLAQYAARIAERTEHTDRAIENLRGTISGIVGTGASIDAVIGEGTSLEFEKAVLAKLDLRPDTTATQIVQKERLSDVGHGLVSLMHVLGDLANDIRILYSSDIGEVTSRDNAQRLGGSSADATKNNPTDWENIAGTVPVVEGGMRLLYSLIQSDLQRDLRGSKTARYQPQAMMAEVYESFLKAQKALAQLSINTDRIAQNFETVRKNPSEAMVAILRGAGWIHSEYGVGHSFVKEMGKRAKTSARGLLEVCLEDPEFNKAFSDTLPPRHRRILQGELELYTGHSHQRAKENRDYARSVFDQKDI